MFTYSELESALNSTKKEREIAAFLNKDLFWLNALNVQAFNCVIQKSEFSIGTEYRADYLVLSACSGHWNCILIEMQSPTDPIYIKSNAESLGLREARRQIEDWRAYIDENKNTFRDQLSKIVKGKPAYCSNVSVHQTAETEIRDPHTVIFFYYKVLIGRRKDLTENNARRSQTSDFEIVTFDRLLDYVKKIEDNTMLVYPSIRRK